MKSLEWMTPSNFILLTYILGGIGQMKEVGALKEINY